MNHEIIDTIRLLRSTRHVDLKQEYLLIKWNFCCTVIDVNYVYA